MASIHIIKRPAGEAPADIRQSWVGLKLPLLNGSKGQRMNHEVIGVLSYPKNQVSMWIDWLFKRYEVWDGYAVDAALAINILAQTDLNAAKWWQSNRPDLLEEGNVLIFPADACREEN
jgi:hypothetical protein